MAMAEQTSAEPKCPRQFTLGGLMLFVVAWCAYFSVVAAVKPLLGDSFPTYTGYEPTNPPNNGWVVATTIVGCWILLLSLYRRWGLRLAVKVHYGLPVTFAVLYIGGLIPRGPLTGLAALQATLYGCYGSIIFGFPIAMMKLIFVDRRSDRNKINATAAIGVHHVGREDTEKNRHT
jgi:hypothetical protein